MQAFSSARAKLVLRSSHRRLRIGVSHRDVPSAWSPPSKESGAPARPVAKRPKR